MKIRILLQKYFTQVLGVARWPSDLSKDGNWVDSGVLFNTFSLFGSWQICRCLGIIYPLHPISLFLKLVIFRQIPTIHIQITALVNIYSLIQIYSIPNFIQQIMRKKGQSRVRIHRNTCLLDVLCRQQIKLFQVDSTSELHEYWWNDLENNFLVLWLSAGPQKLEHKVDHNYFTV